MRTLVTSDNVPKAVICAFGPVGPAGRHYHCHAVLSEIDSLGAKKLKSTFSSVLEQYQLLPKIKIERLENIKRHCRNSGDMNINFFSAAMKAMGFRKLQDAEEISATFSSITVYEARGIALAPGVTEVIESQVLGFNYQLAVSASVNEACTALYGDNFTDNEEDWKKQNKTNGPFILVQLGPTGEYKCTNGHINIEEDGSVTTYDCFPDAKEKLKHLESKALSPIISALTCVLNEETRYVALRKIERASVGRTIAGVVVRDIRMEFQAEAYGSYNLSAPQLTEKLDIAKNLTSVLNSKASRLFALALAEEDQLKRFLYFFLALEVETHAVFGRIDHAAGLTKMLDGAHMPGESTVKLLQTQVDKLKNLYDRFVWCASCKWPNVKESDLAQFKLLKKARDDIAHGSASEPPQGYARLAELLAHKVLMSANERH